LGNKIDYMNGQSTNKGGFVNVPGGAQVLFSTTGVVNAYRHADWLGSKRLSTGTGRGVNTDVAYAPYGERYANSVGTIFNFTGMDNDTKSDLYDFPAREYHPTQGRWVSPDPTFGDLTNPQTFNKYAYVGGNPLAATDPTGLWVDTPGTNVDISHIFFDKENAYFFGWFSAANQGGGTGQYLSYFRGSLRSWGGYSSLPGSHSEIEDSEARYLAMLADTLGDNKQKPKPQQSQSICSFVLCFNDKAPQSQPGDDQQQQQQQQTQGQPQPSSAGAPWPANSPAQQAEICQYWSYTNWVLRGGALFLTASGAGSEVGVPMLVINFASSILQSSWCGATHW
jgi:RHS repeat-associated protein